jgi:hypothetical protein
MAFIMGLFRYSGNSVSRQQAIDLGLPHFACSARHGRRSKVNALEKRMPWRLVSHDLVFSAVFGGITAAGTMIMAQRNEAAHPVTVQELLDGMERESLGAGEAIGYRKTERSRSAEKP